MSKRCVFQDDWLSDPSFSSWIGKIPLNDKVAKCNICNKIFELSNMGRRAVSSHMNGFKHKKKAKAILRSVSFTNPKESLSADIEMKTTTSDNDIQIASCSTNVSSAPIFEKKVDQMKSYLIKDSVTKGEILWTIECVMTHTSFRTAGQNVLLFKTIFSDSETAQKMQLQRDKLGYLLVYGITPFFKAELSEKLNECDFFVVGFDESLNKVAQKQQMDINMRFWNEDTQEVCTRYLTSVFLGRTRASDLLQGFKDGLKDFDLKKILQISMDGPYVNFRFLKDLMADLATDTGDPHGKKPLHLGSCGLHTL